MSSSKCADGDTRLHLGRLSHLSPRALRRIINFLEPRDLLQVIQSCWCLFTLASEESVWRSLCLGASFVQPATKLGEFTFKGSWKRTVLNAKASITPPSITISEKIRRCRAERKPWRGEDEVQLRIERALGKNSDMLEDAAVQQSSSSLCVTPITSSVTSGLEWNQQILGKVYSPTVLEDAYLGLSHGGINYFTSDGYFLRPPAYALKFVRPTSEYKDNNLMGKHLLDVVPLPAPYTKSMFYKTWEHKQHSGASAAEREPYVPLLPPRTGDYRQTAQSPVIYDEQVGLAGVVDRRFCPSVEMFKEQYESTNTPVVLTGCIEDWPARQRWRVAEFCAHYGDIPLKTNGRSTDGRRFRLRARDYFAYGGAVNGEKPMYVFDKKVLASSTSSLAPGIGRAEYASKLRSDYAVLEYFSEDYFSLMSEAQRPDYRWLLIGGEGSGSPFHKDPHGTSAWNAVLDGCKRVSFYPPEAVPPGVDEKLIHSEYYASEAYMAWYRRRLPKLTESAHAVNHCTGKAKCSQYTSPIEALVFPGDIVFIPSGWWHQVLNIGFSIAVTQNVCSRYTFSRVVEDMNAYAGRSVRRDFQTALRKAGRDDLAVQLRVRSRVKAEEARDTSSGSSNSSVSTSSSKDDW